MRRSPTVNNTNQLSSTCDPDKVGRTSQVDTNSVTVDFCIETIENSTFPESMWSWQLKDFEILHLFLFWRDDNYSEFFHLINLTNHHTQQHHTRDQDPYPNHQTMNQQMLQNESESSVADGEGDGLVVCCVGECAFVVIWIFICQTQSRQSAWLISFLTWFLFEVLVSSTGLVFVSHLLIPLYVIANQREGAERHHDLSRVRKRRTR